MGKRKVGFKKPRQKGVDRLRNAVDSDDDEGGGKELDDGKLESVLDDEIDRYNADKQQEARNRGKKTKGKKKQQDLDSDDEEQEVYGLDVSSDEEENEDGDENTHGNLLDSSEDEDKDEEDDSDDEEDEDSAKGDEDNADRKIPDNKAWGKRARNFFNTDYVDQDFGGFEGSDGELAQQEEDEAKEIQKRLTAELDESDFLDFMPAVQSNEKIDKSKSQNSKEFLRLDLDLNNLSAVERKKLIERECPEVVHLLEEYKDKLNVATAVRNSVKSGDISDEVDPETRLMNDFYMTKYLCILNYCINISYFLYLRSTNPKSCKGHPVGKTIMQYRRLLDELNQFKPVHESSSSDSELANSIPSRKLKTKIVTSKRRLNDVDELQDDEMGSTLKKKVKNGVAKEVATTLDAKSQDEINADDPVEKRGITREMAKNKGLTPKRKKEQRNPRVKHREKYRKAKIRRKGQVRNPRTEIKKYDGEAYGIKSHITKSIKLK